MSSWDSFLSEWLGPWWLPWLPSNIFTQGKIVSLCFSLLLFRSTKMAASAFISKQFNVPMKHYTNENIANTLGKQTQVLANGALGQVYLFFGSVVLCTLFFFYSRNCCTSLKLKSLFGVFLVGLFFFLSVCFPPGRGQVIVVVVLCHPPTLATN